MSIRFVHLLFTGLYVFLINDHLGSLWEKLPLSFSHDSMRHSTYIPDVGCSSQFEWSEWKCVSDCLSERKSEWMCEMSVFVFLFFEKKNLHRDLIWSDRNLALLWSEMIGKSLASLHGVEQSTNSRASTLYVVVRGDELIRYTSSLWVWVYLKSHGGHWV